jgi:hypothetical protein
MKRFTLAGTLLACASVAFAQMYAPPPTQPQLEAPKQRSDTAPAAAAPAPQVNLPKSQCEPKPVFPAGATQLAMENKRRAFDRDFEKYKTCMTAYIDERKAMHEANAALHKAAIDEYNATMKAVNEAREANR